MASEVALVPREEPSQPPGTLVPAGRGRPLLVDGEGPPTRGDTLRNPNPGPPPILGCVPSWLGRSPPQPIGVGSMVTPGELVTHQSPGVKGPCFLALRAFQASSHRPPSDSDVRQFDCGRLCEQTGGHGLRLPLLVDRATSPMDGIKQSPTGSKIPAGTVQRPGGPAQSPQPGPGCGVVAPPAGGKGPTAQVGVPHARPVRNTPQSQAASVLLPGPGSPGPLRGRLPAPLGQSRHVCVSPLPTGRENGGSGQRDPKSLDDSSRPSPAGEGVVRGTNPPPDPTTSGTTTVGSPAAPTPLPPVPRRRPRPEPSCVAAIKRLLRKSGFSRGAALELSSYTRESTARLYQSQWLSFCGWCRGRSIAPINATVPLIVDFLIHLRKDKGFSLSALKGYRSAINSVLALNGTDLSDSQELFMLFRSFAKSCPTTGLRPPAWDAALVLNSLTTAPYEPLKDAEERLLAHKTLFLLALASVKRVGELHALSHRVSHSAGWREVSFSFAPGFVAKTQDQSSPEPRFKSFTIHALPKSRDSPNGRLCARYVQSSTT